MWVDRGFVNPTYPAPAKGSGYRHFYSFGDIVRIVLFKKLRTQGLALSSASRVASGVRERAVDAAAIAKPDDIWLILAGEEPPRFCFQQDFDKHVAAARPKVFSAANLSQIVREVVAALREG